MKKVAAVLAALVGLFLSGSASAQCSRIIQNGTVQNNASVVWVAPCVIGQAGPSTGSAGVPPMISDLGVQGNIGILNAPITGNYDSALLGWSPTTPNEFDINLFGVGNSVTAAWIINGTKYSIPGPGTGNVIGPISPYPTATNAVIWNGLTNVADAGHPPALKPSTTPTTGHMTCWGATTLTDCGTTPGNAVVSNAAVQALVGLPSGTTVFRQSFWPNLNLGASSYTFTSANCSVADNGLQITPNSGGGCWLANLTTSTPGPELWGATGSQQTATCSTAGTTLTCSGGVADFQVNQPITVVGAGTTATPPAPTFTLAATGGSGTTYWYTIAPIDAAGGVGAAVAAKSVSGGLDLGTANDMNLALTGNMTSSTTITNLELGGTPCTAATCPLGVGGHIHSNVNIAAGTSISTITSATAITVNNATLTTGNNLALVTASPSGGVYNTITVTGSATSYAIYEGTSSSFSSMTCIGVMPVDAILNANNTWNDYGAVHYTACPSWIPNVPSASPTGDFLRTTIAGISGNMITTTAGTSQTLASTSVVHDDTLAWQNAEAANLAISTTCGGYNIFAAIQASGTSSTNMNGCGTVYGWGAGYDDLVFGSGTAGAALLYSIINDANKASNFAVFANHSRPFFILNGLALNNVCNGLKLFGLGNSRLSNIGTSLPNSGGVRCQAGIYIYGTTATPSVGVTISDAAIGTSQAQNANAAGIVINGNANTTRLEMVTMQDFPQDGLIVENVGSISSSCPAFLNAYDLEVNVNSGTPITLNCFKNNIRFQNSYIQGQPGNGASCVVVGALGVGAVGFSGGTQILGCDNSGIVDSAAATLELGGGDVEVYSNNKSEGNYDKVRLNTTAGAATIKLASGDSFSSNVNANTSENCGVNIVSGYSTQSASVGTPMVEVVSSGPGMQAPVCDSSGVYGLVRVDGQFNSPTWVTNSGGGTLTTGEMLRNQNDAVPAIYVSGNVSGTPVTWTTATATALVNALVNVYANQQFSFHIYNQGGSTVTLGAGAGVTVSGTATTLAGAIHLFRCQVTNVGSPAITCAG